MAAFDVPSPARKHTIRNLFLILLSVLVLLAGGLLYRVVKMRNVPIQDAEAEKTPAESEETIKEAEDPVAEEETGSDEAQETDEPVISQAPSHTLPKVEVFVREKQEISMEPWEGNTDGHSTQFKCDMDDDGKMEDYLFGVDYINSPHENVVYYDRNMPIPDLEVRRDVHPCVWRVLEDGSMEVATEFAELLTDVYVRIWRVDDFVSPEPEAWSMAYAWPGCVSVTFYPEQDCTWFYEVGADLAGEHLTASATTTFVFE